MKRRNMLALVLLGLWSKAAWADGFIIRQNDGESESAYKERAIAEHGCNVYGVGASLLAMLPTETLADYVQRLKTEIWAVRVLEGAFPNTMGHIYENCVSDRLIAILEELEDYFDAKTFSDLINKVYTHKEVRDYASRVMRGYYN